MDPSIPLPLISCDDRIRRPLAAETACRARRGPDVGLRHRIRVGHAGAARLGTGRIRRREGQSGHVLARHPRRHGRQHAGRRRRLLDRLPRESRLRQGTQVALVPLAGALRLQDHAAVLGAGHRRPAVHAGRLAAPAVLVQRHVHVHRQVRALRVHDGDVAVRAERLVEVDRGYHEPVVRLISERAMIRCH